MKNILLISFRWSLARCPRTQRYLEILKDEYRLSVIGYDPPNVEGVDFYKIKRRAPIIFFFGLHCLLNLFRLHDLAYAVMYNFGDTPRRIRQRRFDLIIARDIETLPLAFSVAQGAKIIFDAPEYTPRQFEDQWWWRVCLRRYKQRLCDKFLNKVDAMTTVCDGIADEYRKNFGIPRPEVLTNASFFYDLKPSPVQSDRIKIIHHGFVTPTRKIELMIQMMDYVDARFVLNLILIPIGSKIWYNRLLKEAKKRPNIKILDPVPFRQIVPMLNAYDMGLYLLPPSTFNTQHSLPNKFFEFIQARLGVAIGPSVEMARIVKKYNCGVVSSTFHPKDLAETLNRLTEKDIMNFKAQSDKAARELNSEETGIKLKKIVVDLLDKKSIT